MATWIAAYDAGGIVPEPPPVAVQHIADEAIILSSPLPRAIQSARLLAKGRPVEIVPEAREAALPVWHLAAPALPPDAWLAALRLGWFLGLHGTAEPMRTARRRSEVVARLLAERAREQGTVCLVGHGVLNGLVARSLRRTGWTGPRLPPGGYWGCRLHTPA